MKRWSRLYREIRRFFAAGLDLDIHAVAYPMDSNYGHDKKIPRFWVTMGKEILWDWPALPPHNGNQYWVYREVVEAIPISLRAHIDRTMQVNIAAWLASPQEYDWSELRQPPPSLIEILVCADRRLGKKWASAIFARVGTEPAKRILLTRWPDLARPQGDGIPGGDGRPLKPAGLADTAEDSHCAAFGPGKTSEDEHGN